ncbi:MAG: DUF839 domain-containing protein [Acidimicrobiia bacterium]|nr:DUF839 domain-containing protein [Acidimicrobiia bacterium]
MQKKRLRRRMAAAVAVPAAAAVVFGACSPLSVTGPNSATAPYVHGVANDTIVRSLLTVNDAKSTDDGYELVGIPDGLGATTDDNGNIVLDMNHELTSDKGIARLHGERGAFVSQFVIDPSNRHVLSGRDLIEPGVEYWDYLDHSYDDTAPAAGTRTSDGKQFPAYLNAFGRFCSSSLTAPGQLFNPLSGRGYTGQIYFANEETGDEGRVFGVSEDGQARQLPRLGLASWENTNVASTPNSDATVVVGDEDSADGQLWLYAGRKVAAGGAFQRAGLLNGTHYAVTLNDGNDATTDPANDAQFRAAYNKGDAVPFTLTTVGSDQSGADQNAEAKSEGLSLNRIEDGAFDPSNPNDYYFVTTEGGEGTTDGGGGGLWRLRFTDVAHPQQGGTLTLLLDGTESIGLNKPDNIAIDANGNMMIQEDPGADDSVARIVAYRISDGATGVVAQFNLDQFDPSVGSPNFITNDEETSGIIDASDTLGDGNWLFSVQVHSTKGLASGNGEGTVEEYVENGQLDQLTINNYDEVYGSNPT